MPGQLTLLDAPSLWYRAFHGVPESITAPDGSPVNAVRGTVDLVARIVKDTRPARLVACLPVAVLLMGSGAGSDPWSFLLRTPVGWVCGAAGLTLVALGLWWIERLADEAAAP